MDFFRALLQPLPLLLFTLGFLLARAYRAEPSARRRLRPVVAAFLALYVLSTPAAAFVATATLEWQYRPIDIANDVTYDAAVVLGSVALPADAAHPRPRQDEAGLERTRYGASLFLRGRVPLVLVSGGVADADGGVANGPVMADDLRAMGVPADKIVVEAESATTRENAAFTAAILRERGLTRIVVVTDGRHMMRSLAAFRAEGVEAKPAACGLRTWGMAWSARHVVPSASALEEVRESVREWCLWATYRVRGWAG